MFRRPKKPIQRRVFSSYGDGDEDDENNDSNDTKMDIEPPSKSKKDKSKSKDNGKAKKPSLLSFDDEGKLLILPNLNYLCFHYYISN